MAFAPSRGRGRGGSPRERADDGVDVVPHHAEVGALRRARGAHRVGEELAADGDVEAAVRTASWTASMVAGGTLDSTKMAGICRSAMNSASAWMSPAVASVAVLIPCRPRTSMPYWSPK